MTLLFEAAIKISAVIAVGLIAAALLRHKSAALRHWVLASAVAAALATPLLTSLAPSWSLPRPTPVDEPPQTTAARSVRIGVETGLAAPASTRTVPERPIDVRVLMLTLWGAGVVVNLAALVIGLRRLRSTAARATVVREGPWADAVRDLSGHFGLHQPVRLLQSDQPAVLVTWGHVAPKIMLPIDAPSWEPDRIRVVLAHELAHVQRGDWIVQIASELLRIVSWFNPLVWFATARLRLESERACDDAVVNLGVSGDDYAEHLLELARQFGRSRQNPLPAVAIVPRPSSLHRRVTAMLNPHLSRRPVSRAVRLTTVGAILACALPIALFAQNRFSTVAGSITDESAAFLPGASVVAVDTARGARHEVQTNRSGRFEILGLPEGAYVLEVSLPGFKTTQQKLTLNGQDEQRDFTLELGSLEETISVTAGALPPVPGERREARPANCNAAAAAAAAGTPRVGGQIRQPWKVRHVAPIYPENAAAGMVKLEAVIGPDGYMQEVKAVNDAPAALAQAAIDAVRQWEFEPTLLNCVAVPVNMTVTVFFG